MRSKPRAIGSGLILAAFLIFAASVDFWVNLALSLI